MKVIVDRCFDHQSSSTKTNTHFDQNEPKKNSHDSQSWRDTIAYWLLGLTTEFGYVVIICAAHDILHSLGQTPSVIF